MRARLIKGVGAEAALSGLVQIGRRWLGFARLCAVLAALPLASHAQGGAAESRPLPPELRDRPASAGVPQQHVPAPALDRVRRSGVLNVGVVALPPWTFSGKDGQLTGFEVEVARRLAADLGVALRLVRTGLQTYAGDLSDGLIDVAAAGLWPDPTNALLVNFSNPYAAVAIDLVGNRARVGGRKSLADFNQSSMTIGVRSGGHSESVARANFGRARLSSFDSNEKMLEALAAGKVDAVVAPRPVIDYLVATSPKTFDRPLAAPLAERREAFAIARGDPDFLAYLNAWIIYQKDTGWLERRRAYWFQDFSWVPGS